MEIHRLGVGGVDLQRPLAVYGLAELFDDRDAERRKKFLGNMALDVAA